MRRMKPQAPRRVNKCLEILCILLYTTLACRCDGMVDVTDSKSVGVKPVWVRVPPPAPALNNPLWHKSPPCGEASLPDGVVFRFQIESASLSFDLVLGLTWKQRHLFCSESAEGTTLESVPQRCAEYCYAAFHENSICRIAGRRERFH